jgi:hypothetical protein
VTRDPQDGLGDDELVEVRLLHYPLAVAERTSEHYEGVIREMTLLVADGEAVPGSVPEELSRLTRELDSRRARNSELEEVRLEALARGETHRDLALKVPPSVAEISRSMHGLLDQADRYCREGLVLSLPPDADMVAFRRWYLDEVISQVSGGQPRPWVEDQT